MPTAADCLASTSALTYASACADCCAIAAYCRGSAPLCLLCHHRQLQRSRHLSVQLQRSSALSSAQQMRRSRRIVSTSPSWSVWKSSCSGRVASASAARHLCQHLHVTRCWHHAAQLSWPLCSPMLLKFRTAPPLPQEYRQVNPKKKKKKNKKCEATSFVSMQMTRASFFWHSLIRTSSSTSRCRILTARPA